jgi:hypothetical protein
VEVHLAMSGNAIIIQTVAFQPAIDLGEDFLSPRGQGRWVTRTMLKMCNSTDRKLKEFRRGSACAWHSRGPPIMIYVQLAVLLTLTTDS